LLYDLGVIRPEHILSDSVKQPAFDSLGLGWYIYESATILVPDRVLDLRINVFEIGVECLEAHFQCSR
jgi:hypothetical protein